MADTLDDWDILGRWMAHYIAELIAAAASPNPDTDPWAARERAAHEIRAIWSNRDKFQAPYPLESFDRIFEFIDRFEGRTASARLRRYFGNSAPSESQLAAVPILEVAARLDDDLSDVITALIAEAVAEAEDEDASWMPVALEIGHEHHTQALRRLLKATRRRFANPTGSPTGGEHPRRAIAGPAAESPDDGKTAAFEAADPIRTNNSDIGGPEDGDRSETNDVSDDHRYDGPIGDEDGDSTAARQEALIEAIDDAINTLSALRTALTVSPSDGPDLKQGLNVQRAD